MAPENPDYPARLDIQRPERLSRLLPFVKWLLAFPHYIALYVLEIVAFFVLVASWFAVIITAAYPEPLFNFLAGVERWRLRVTAYIFLQTDRYPPFGLADDIDYPVRFQVEYPSRIARWRPLVSWLLVIPALLGAFVIGIAAFIAVFVAFFAIVFTGRYPQSLFDTVTIAERWSARCFVYSFWMTGAYPPFVWA